MFKINVPTSLEVQEFYPLYKGKCLIKLQCSKPTLPVEEPLIIERHYPQIKNKKSYPERYDNSIFEKLNEMNADTELQNDYERWNKL